MIRRQVTEIPEARAEVTEHQIIGRRCDCGTVAWADAPEGVTAPVQYGPRAAAIGAYLWHGQFLSRDRACAAMADLFGCAPSPGALASMTRKIAAAAAPALDAVRGALAAAGVAHFDETGFRVAGRLAWVHSASSGKYALVTVHAKRGKDGMDAAGVLPAFGGIACHDAWAPYDCYAGVAGHALCNAHVLRELTAVTETGTADDVIWARQAIDALLALKEAADEARAAGSAVISPETMEEHSRWFREAAAAGIALNAGRCAALQRKRHALAARMSAREADYLRFASDLRVPFDNNPAEQVIRMAKLRSRSPAACARCAEQRSSARSAPTSPPPPATASAGSTPSPAPPAAAPGSPKPDKPARQYSATHPGRNRNLSSYAICFTVEAASLQHVDDIPAS